MELHEQRETEERVILVGVEEQAGENADKEDEIRVQWQGISNNAKTFMYVYKQRQEAGIRWTPNRRQTGKT